MYGNGEFDKEIIFLNRGYRTRVLQGTYKVKHVAIEEAIDKRDAANNKIVRFLKRY